MANKILMVQSYLGRKEPVIFPVALATIASRLGDGYQLSGFDPNVVLNPEEDLRKKVGAFAPDVVAISLRNIDTTNFFDPHIYYNGFQQTLKTIKKARPDALLIAGGAGFSLFADRIMADNPEIDVGVYLEAEETVPDLLRHLDEPETVRGIFYRKNGKPCFTGCREPGSIEEAPLPLWEIFDVPAYRRHPFPFGIETKRGCAFRCVYCSYFILHGKKIRLKKPERVVSEILELRRRFDIKQICFLDSVFNVPLDHAMDILRLMRKNVSDVEWLGYVSEKGMTQEFAELAMQTGVGIFVFSLDAFTDECLELMGKGTTVDQVKRAVDIIGKTAGAEIGFNFFVNGPGYTYGTLLMLMLFLLRTKMSLGKKFRLLKVGLGYIRIEPETPLYEHLIHTGGISKEADLLPPDPQGFRRCFYFNNNLRLFNFLFISGKRMVKGVGNFLKQLVRNILPSQKTPAIPKF